MKILYHRNNIVEMFKFKFVKNVSSHKFPDYISVYSFDTKTGESPLSAQYLMKYSETRTARLWSLTRRDRETFFKFMEL